mmetsp:Transcript_23526/g.49294  ORF Transcript_23526/g.49294 Transcript_23526/m.49294 type:complete len:657 (+) Transcript_23526:153-2123(+)
MADCSASGTAIDRVIQSAVASSLNQGNNGAAASSAAAASAATRAFGNFFGGTAATASSLSGPSIMGDKGRMIEGGASATMGSQQMIMPLVPLQTIGVRDNMHQQGMVDGAASSSRLDDAWAASSTGITSAVQHAPMNHQMIHSHPQQQQQIPMQGQMSSLNHHVAPPQMMMQQQQMMMMQHMQMQQHQMAAMVQYQQQQQQMIKAQKQNSENRASTATRADGTAEFEATTVDNVDDDVATVSEEEQIHHEGLTEDASIERLAQAWRDAEAEFADEFGEDEYDVSDLGGLYDEGYQATTDTGTATADNANNVTTEPQYEFSEASRTYGCLQTQSTDIAPTTLDYPENLYERGLEHFDEGNIPSAILCFESTLRNIDPEHADAWRMLGKCHTENDEDQKAITCWLRSLERDPFSPETLLAMGVAYVNELDHERAVETLRGWVANHPLYAGMVDSASEGAEEDLYGSGDMEEEMDGVIDGSAAQQHRRMRSQTMVEMRDVERLLLRALEYDHTADAAADVYEALGVVYNVSRDYDAAVDAFRRAIDVRPDDYQLRNKLGATLANGNRSEEALPSYHVALRLKPKYARGWLNMAISHSNMNNYSEAARCYLQTLSLNPEARHVWSYLRIALTCEEQWDLLPLAAAQDLSAFRDHFDFVEY